MMVFRIFELLTDALLGDWEAAQWTVASSICDSLVTVLRNR
jgi:hypothetical protein